MQEIKTVKVRLSGDLFHGREVLVVAGADGRPVDFAVSSDGRVVACVSGYGRQNVIPTGRVVGFLIPDLDQPLEAP